MPFKTGAVVDLVPQGSLASRLALIKKGEDKVGYRSISPNVGLLWREHCEKPKREDGRPKN